MEAWRVQALLDSTPFDELPDDLELTTRQAAPFCGPPPGLRPETLDKYRQLGKGPAYVRYGDGPRARVKYRVADIRAWNTRYMGVRVDPEAGQETEETPARCA
jgi:hypothetical protein